MTTEVYTISSDQSVVTAAARMRELAVGSLVVTRGDAVEGIITTWDLAVGCMGAGHDTRECVVFHHMSSPVHTARPETDTLEAAHTMAQRRITRLPVVENGKLVGIASFANISRALDRLLHDLHSGWERPAV
ncbi:MAG: CBS domain-containing protein [Dehalococcoidia bacterium]